MLPFNTKPKVAENNKVPNFIYTNTKIKEETKNTPTYITTTPKVVTENTPTYSNVKPVEFTGNEYINKNVIEKVQLPKEEQPTKKNYITVKIPTK